jgi:hypothetical protein
MSVLDITDFTKYFRIGPLEIFVDVSHIPATDNATFQSMFILYSARLSFRFLGSFVIRALLPRRRIIRLVFEFGRSLAFNLMVVIVIVVSPTRLTGYQHRVNGASTLFWSLAEVLLVPCGLSSTTPLGLSVSRSSRCFRFFEVGLHVDFGLALTEAGIGFGMSNDARSALFFAIRSSRSRS